MPLLYIYILLLMVIIYLLNLFIISHYGIGIQNPPYHDSSLACHEKRFLLCTTSRGKCRHKKVKCAFPQKQKECTYVKQFGSLKKNVRKSIEKSNKNDTKLTNQWKEHTLSDIFECFYQLLLAFFIVISLIKLYLMAKRPMTNGEKQTRNICIAFVLIFVLVGVGANLIVASEFGIYLQIGAPTHDSPMSCDQEGYFQCTTREGKCTKEQDKCVYPESGDDCSILLFKKKLQKSEKKTLKSLYKDEFVRLEKTKVLEEYCSTEMIYLYEGMANDLSTWTFIFEVVLSIALFGLFFSEIVRISHNLAYN